MTPEERAFCEEIRADAMKILATAGLIERDALSAKDSKQAWRANKISLALLDMVKKTAAREANADVTAEAREVAAGGYDLAALATAPPATIED